MEPLPDRIRRCWNSGDRDAWLDVVDQVVSEHAPLLRGYLAHRLPSAAVDDVLQEVLTAIVLGLHRFEGRTNAQLRAWCFRIAGNKLADYFRQHQHDPLAAVDRDALWREIEALVAGEQMSAADQVDFADAMDLLCRVNPKCFHYLWEHYILDYDYQQIADLHGLSYDGARMQIARCLKRAQGLFE